MAIHILKNKFFILTSRLIRTRNIRSAILVLFYRCKKYIKSQYDLLGIKQKKEEKIANRIFANDSDKMTFKENSERHDNFSKDISTESGTPKTIIVVSMVKDEEKIIESSIRWWLTFSDRIIIFNHYSTDRTLEILHQLQKEYESKIVLFNPSFDTRKYAQVKIRKR